MEKITIRGARQHNLKNISLEIPKGKLIVITGVSGSGKSSLAFDTLYAEGQRRYVESLSSYARQFLEQMERPDVDSIEGLSPSISIDQKSVSHNPRSTVSTVTEIYDYLRVLYARVGKPYCYKCGKEISGQTVQQIVDQILSLGSTKAVIYAPIVRGRKGEFKKELIELAKEGFTRIRLDGTTYSLPVDLEIDKNKKHTLELVIDRIKTSDEMRGRIAESIELAVEKAKGIVRVETEDGREMIFSTRFSCVECGTNFPEIEPRFFSFNNPYGACPECAGIGKKWFFDEKLIITSEDLPLIKALPQYIRANEKPLLDMLEALSKHYGFSLTVPYKNIPPEIRKKIFYGTEEEIEFFVERAGRRQYFKKPFEGIIKYLQKKYEESEYRWEAYELEKLMTFRTCPLCNGARLRKESLSVKIMGLNIYEFTKFTTLEALNFLDRMWENFTEKEKKIAEKIVKEIRDRLRFMIKVGLDYLTLDRSSYTLSGGESQRIRLATQLGSRLTGVLYVLDEPSIGLHPRDTQMLLETLKELRDIGNTVIVVEHDADTIRSADFVIDMGPGAGVNGGWVVATGSPDEIMKNENSLTGQYLSGMLEIEIPPARRSPVPGRYLLLKGAKGNNLKNINVKFPLGVFICVTGVSGSGKSSLITDTLYPALAKKLYNSKDTPLPYTSVEGIEHIDKVIEIDQSPIGRTPRSNPATYVGVFTPIRELFAQLPEARARGYKPGRFSFNVKGGRCEACQGEGVVKVEMHFLPDVYVKCDVCGGKRFDRETLEIKFKGLNIYEVLELTVEEAFDIFKNIPRIRNKLQTLKDVGLDYIKLGQPAPTLSGGEAQRVKLAKELSRRATGRTVYILDEPTTGLHFHDVKKLLNVLSLLVDQGNTVIVIEHNLEVIKCADYIIDLGPEGGDRGGEIVAEGTPEEVAQNPNSYTGKHLLRILGGKTAGNLLKRVL
jgi:excinuclease ABC subunit A